MLVRRGDLRHARYTVVFPPGRSAKEGLRAGAILAR